MRTKLVLVIVAAVAAGVLFFRGGDEVESSHETTWKNQVWIDAIPVRETDKMNIFAALEDPQFGVFQTTSQWEGDYTVFQWKEKKQSQVEIEMMQTGKKHKLKPSVSNKNCGNFDICMTLKGAPRGPKTYYSMHDWVIESRGMSPAQLTETALQLVKSSRDAD